MFQPSVIHILSCVSLCSNRCCSFKLIWLNDSIPGGSCICRYINCWHHSFKRLNLKWLTNCMTLNDEKRKVKKGYMGAIRCELNAQALFTSPQSFVQEPCLIWNACLCLCSVCLIGVTKAGIAQSLSSSKDWFSLSNGITAKTALVRSNTQA